MDKTLQLVEEIKEEMSNVRQLMEKVHTKYQIIGALLLSAKKLVPPDRWESWLHANFGITVLAADKVMNVEGEIVINELYDFNLNTIPLVKKYEDGTKEETQIHVSIAKKAPNKPQKCK